MLNKILYDNEQLSIIIFFLFQELQAKNKKVNILNFNYCECICLKMRMDDRIPQFIMRVLRWVDSEATNHGESCRDYHLLRPISNVSHLSIFKQ